MGQDAATPSARGLRKLFGGIDLTWTKLIVFAVIAGVYTGVMAVLPAAKDTSFADISISFEWWVLFAVIIIANCHSAKEAALKCFVFFLISQPLVYLVEVPFSSLGWGIFGYYPRWFMWTLLTLPMAYVGYHMKDEKWYSVAILAVGLAFVGYHYEGFLHETLSFFPNHLLSAVFCAATMVIYPLCIFKDRRLRIAGLIISAVLIVAMSVVAVASEKAAYRTEVLMSGGEVGGEFDDTYSVALEDESFGPVEIIRIDALDCYAVHGEFVRTGSTKLFLTAPDGTVRVFALDLGRDTYDIAEVTAG